MANTIDDEAPLDAVVLGAGISGLVSTAVLLEQGARRIAVLAEYDHVGGNHIDRNHDRYTYDIGSLILQDDSPLLAHFPQILPLYVPVEPCWSRLNPQGKVTHYPFSIRDDVVAVHAVEWFRMLWSVLADRIRKRKQRNVRDFAEHLFGARFVERSGLGFYMRRLCGLLPEEIDLEFAKHHLGWLKEQASLGNIARRLLRSLTGNPELPIHNRQLARPREGYSFLYRPAVERLEARGAECRLDTSLQRIRRVGEDVEIEMQDGYLRARRFVSTIPIDRALQLCVLDAPGQPSPTVTLLRVFSSFEGSRGFRTLILYNFSREGDLKRVTAYSDFYGAHGGREYFTAEVIGQWVNNSVEAAEREFRDHCAANALFVGDLRLEGSHVLHNAYPIYAHGSEQRARDAMRSLRDLGIEALGGQGTFPYQPTARESTVAAELALRGSPATRGSVQQETEA